MKSVNEVLVSPEVGLEGDHYHGRSGQRHVTLVQAEHLPVIASCVGQSHVAPESLRRNLVVKGINLLALRNKIVTVGGVELEVTGLCHPCSRMEETLGPKPRHCHRNSGT